LISSSADHNSAEQKSVLKSETSQSKISLPAKEFCTVNYKSADQLFVLQSTFLRQNIDFHL